MRRVLAIVALALTGCTGMRVLAPAEIPAASDQDLVDARYGVRYARAPRGWESPAAYREALIREHARRARWTDDELRQALAGEIQTGMREDVAYWSWGHPREMHESTSPYGQVNRWYYGGPANDWSVTIIDGRVRWFRGDQPEGYLRHPDPRR